MSSEPAPEPVRIDKVRASREGHTYHDTWTARVALELLIPTTTLTAVAVEGLSTEDAEVMSAAAIEIADLVRYRGGVGVAQASHVEVVQFKYSIANAALPMRAADVRKTLSKFATTDTRFVAAVGAERVAEVVRYEFVTNRPFHPNLVAAIDGIRRGLTLSGDVADQATAIIDACGLGESLVGFLDRLSLSGQSSTVSEVRATVHRTIANWGGATDTLSRIRLSNLLELCREKAGAVGQYNNLIGRVDVLAALEVAHENELYPTPDAFPKVGETIHRPVVDTIAEKIGEQGLPILVHAPGGMGKTVVMQALAERFDRDANAVVLFDCFGAGRWRDPADGRHMVQRALPHIANLLAGRGLCDVLLAGGATMDLAQAFRARLTQAVSAVRAVDSNARVILLLDAIDHSGLQASETHTEAFSHVILKSLSISPIEGVSVVGSCRTERREIAKNGAECREIPIGPFSDPETLRVVLLRDATATEAEVAALQTRSGGNPRFLDALIRAGRPYDDGGPTDDTPSRADLLDELLKRRIDDASREALSRGLSQREVDMLLAGLALLPPPVPTLELALALDRPEAAVESFAVDLFPLIDRTQHGLIFHDEPTETLIRRLFKNDSASQAAIIERLERRQTQSIYAARALPIVLTSVGRTEDLIRLAFDSALPESATSRVAQRAIRLSRLVAALVASSIERRADDLTELLLEAARVAGGHERSDAFLLEHPDLVAVSDDPEAVRRLFEVKSGWPGSRHAALAILYALSNDPGEARRNARRALAWLDWRARQPKDPRHSRERTSTDEQDLIGPAYVEALAGNTTRVGRWLDHWNEKYAYTLYSQLVRLLENHAALSSDGAALRGSVVRRAVRCRSKSRALGAALLQHADLPIDDALRVIRRLAAISASCPPVQDDFDYIRKDHSFADALVTAAMRAVRLGQDKEAKAILDGIGLRRLRLHHFGSHWPNTNEIVRFLLAAAVRSALERRAPRLMDVAPDEIHSALRFRKPSPKAYEYERAVKRLLTVPPQHGQPVQRKRRKPRLESKERDEATRVLDHRVRPLLPFVSIIAKLLRTKESDTIVASAISLLTQTAASADSYPFRDGPQYMARVGFGLTVSAVDALDALSAPNSHRLVEWLVSSHLQYTNLWIDTVAVLSRRPETRGAALVLSERATGMIRSDTNIRDRITASGALARAIWRTSRAEAQAHFRRGLDIADAIGSDDYDRAADLIEFATNYSGAPLRPETVHTFARICELTLYDDDKCPWTNFGEAMARVGGLQGLAIVARMADRDKASLGLSLPPLLTSLVKHGRLDPDLAAGLIGLDNPVETWSWRLTALAELVLPGITPSVRDEVMRFFVTELDRRYQGAPRRDTLEGLLRLSRTHLPAASPTLQYLEALMTVREAHHRHTADGTDVTSLLRETETWEAQSASVDLFDGAAIDAALMDHDAEHVGRPAVQLLTTLANRELSVDDRIRFLRAVADAKVPTLADKLLALEDLLKAWRERSLAIADFIPMFVADLSARHADELIGSAWESSYALRKLIEFSGEAPLTIVSSVIEALRGRATDIGGNAWMNFACVAARTATPTAIGSALERFSSMAALDLPEEVADGSWRVGLVVPNESLPAIIGLLWMRLGSPSTADRWRAAHAVRRLVALGHREVISGLVAHFNSEDAGAFQDQKLPFFFLNARFWLLVALARIAIERPEAVLPERQVLERIAFDLQTPHVGMQAFAAGALRAIVDSLSTDDASALRASLERVNTSRFPRAPQNKARKDFYHSSRRDGESERPFYFEYEYSKTDVDSLASVFGVDHSEVVIMATRWIRRWSVDVKNMWECPRRPNSEYADWSRGMPGRHTLGSYLAWHSLMLTAGELLQKTPVTDGFYGDNPWREWLAYYQVTRHDGLWLADATDWFPPDLAASVVPDTSDEHVPADPRELRWLAGLTSDKTVSDEVAIDGWWKSKDGLDVSIDSVVVIPELAQSVAFTVLTVEPFDRWFPREEDLSRRFRRRLPLHRLFREQHHGDRKLDKDDPYATPTALHRPPAARAAIKILRLHSADPFGRSWRNSANVDVFRGDAWGVEQESRDGDAGRSGNRLRVRTTDLLAFLKATQRSLVLLVKVQKCLKDADRTPNRKRRRRRSDDERHSPFVTQTLLAIIGPRSVRTVRRIPKAVRHAVDSISGTYRHEFRDRLIAIARVLLAKYLQENVR